MQGPAHDMQLAMAECGIAAPRIAASTSWESMAVLHMGSGCGGSGVVGARAVSPRESDLGRRYPGSKMKMRSSSAFSFFTPSVFSFFKLAIGRC
jgi:hypothetical protein